MSMTATRDPAARARWRKPLANTRNYTFVLTDEHRVALEELADTRGLSLSEVLRDLIADAATAEGIAGFAPKAGA